MKVVLKVLKKIDQRSLAEILHHEIKERRKYSKQEDDETDEDDDEDETDEESTDEESSDDDDDDDDDWKVKPFQQKSQSIFSFIALYGMWRQM